MKDDLSQFGEDEQEYTRYYVDKKGKVIKVEGPFLEKNDGFTDFCAKVLVNEDGNIYHFVKMAGGYLFNPYEDYRNRTFSYKLVNEEKFNAYAMFLETGKNYLLMKAQRV